MFDQSAFIQGKAWVWLLLALLLAACNDRAEQEQAAADRVAPSTAISVEPDTAPEVLPVSPALSGQGIALPSGVPGNDSIVPAPVPEVRMPGQWVSLAGAQSAGRARSWPDRQGELALTLWPQDRLAAFSLLTDDAGRIDLAFTAGLQVPFIRTVRDATPTTIDWAAFDSILDAGSTGFRAWYVVDYRGLPQASAADELRQVQARVASYRQDVWIGSMTEVARYAQEYASARLENVENNPATVYFDLKDDLDDRQFDQPLTVKVRLPEGWSGEATRATQGGIECPVSVVAHEGKTYALVDAVPDRGTVMVEF